VLGRKSVDGKGTPLLSFVHVRDRDPKNPNNIIPMSDAYWEKNAMYYGDGDGRDWSPLVSLDVAGHEITHGVTQATSKLLMQGQSGGLNEGLSDIFGAGVRWYANSKNP